MLHVSKCNFQALVYAYGKGKMHPCTGMRLCTGHTAHRRSRCIALFFLDQSTRSEWRVSVTPRPLFTHGEDRVSIVQEAGWAPAPVWTGADNLASTGIRSPDRPVRSPVVILTGLPGPHTDYATRPTYAYGPAVNEEYKKISSSLCTIQTPAWRLGIARISYQGFERIKTALMIILNGIIEYYFNLIFTRIVQRHMIIKIFKYCEYDTNNLREIN